MPRRHSPSKTGVNALVAGAALNSGASEDAGAAVEQGPA